MLTAAEAVEAETSKIGPPGASALAVAAIDPGEGSYEETLAGLDAKVEELVAAISRFRSRPFDKTKIRCYNCNKYGHFKNECKEPLRVATSAANTGRTSSDTQQDVDKGTGSLKTRWRIILTKITKIHLKKMK